MKTLGHVAATLSDSEYQHWTQVNVRAGTYRFDCSGMAYWILAHSAPRAVQWISQGLNQRPLARDFQRGIARIPLGQEQHGWLRIGSLEDARPGDVVAWEKPADLTSANTGHVAFLVLPPQKIAETAYLIRVADSTSLLHEDDTREGRTGFGMGTLLLLTDSTGAPRGYGWVALRARTFETRIAVGRPKG